MTVFFFAGKAGAQNHIKIITHGMASVNNTPAVKFRIQWDALPDDGYTHNTKVWLWIDYHKVENNRLSGGWKRAAVTGVSAGTVEPGGKGFWLQGNAGAYSQDITATLAGMPPKFSWCVFASDTPPIAEFTASNTVQFHGSAPFTVTYSDGSMAANLPKTSYTPAEGKKITAFTDATNCPGTVKYTIKTPALSGGGTYCAAAVNLTCNSEPGISYQLQKGDAAEGAVKAGTGTALTWPVRASGSYTLSATHTATGATAASPPQQVTLFREPTAPDSLVTSATTICHAIAAAVTLTATGGSNGSGAVYEWGTGAAPGSYALNPATTTANTYAVSPDRATDYWVRRTGNTACKNTTAAATISISAYAPFTAGTITADSTTTSIGGKVNVTVESLAGASGGGTAISYQWRRSGTDSLVLTGSSASYNLSADTTNFNSPGTYYIKRYAKNDVCDTLWTASGGQYTLIVEENDPDQGACMFKKPPVVGTFADFPGSYSAATYVSLTDERDGKTYVVIKLGDHWIMAQNLNYQKDLSWFDSSKKSETSGMFWCPTKRGAELSTSVNLCNIWGALYNWETAMMVDGKWRDDTRTNSTWPGAACSAKGGNTNGGKGANGHGICPPNWHIPTDEEWGEILNEMETETKNHTDKKDGYLGADAGTRSKSGCICPPDAVTCGSDNENLWDYASGITNTDDYGFRVLPSGFRYYDGSKYAFRGAHAYFWSSTCANLSNTWIRVYEYNKTTVLRTKTTRTSGFSIRCMQD
ncbi:MAG: hypothetical protein LBN98_05985 [Prevotellaceae bacterium]|nr:hypothetical protein [Prevotellaceae bacterium]